MAKSTSKERYAVSAAAKDFTLRRVCPGFARRMLRAAADAQ